MARLTVSASNMKGKVSKEDVEMRAKLEQVLKVNNDKVYQVPKDLNKPTQAIYKALVKELKPLDILCDLDIELLVTVADALYQMKVARNSINTYGHVFYVKDDEGNVIATKKNGSIETYKVFESIFKTSLNQLAMSPTARASLSAKLTDAIKHKEVEIEKSQEEKEIAWLCGEIDTL